jgi:hypothetical protein
VRRGPGLAALWLAGAARLAAAQEAAAPTPAAEPRSPLSEVEAVPQRPTRSESAVPAPLGCVQLEAGANYDADAASADLVLRFGLTNVVEVSLGVTPYLRIEGEAGTESGFGDTVLATKLRFFWSREGSAAIKAFVKIPTADDDAGLGTGETDGGFAFLANRTWGRNSFNFNLGGDFAGALEASSNDARWTTVLTWKRQAGDRFRYFGEIFLRFLPAADVEEITTDWGVSYALNPSFVLDSAVYLGLSDNVPDYELTVGLTKVVGRMFAPPPPRPGRP